MCSNGSLRQISLFFLSQSSVPEIRFVDPRGSHQDIKFVSVGFYLFLRKSPLKIALLYAQHKYNFIMFAKVKANSLSRQIFTVMSNSVPKWIQDSRLNLPPRSK